MKRKGEMLRLQKIKGKENKGEGTKYPQQKDQTDRGKVIRSKEGGQKKS